MPNHSWCCDYVAVCNVDSLKFGIPEDGPKTEASLDLMEHDRPPFDATYSHYPEYSRVACNRFPDALRQVNRSAGPGSDEQAGKSGAGVTVPRLPNGVRQGRSRADRWQGLPAGGSWRWDRS